MKLLNNRSLALCVLLLGASAVSAAPYRREAEDITDASEQSGQDSSTPQAVLAAPLSVAAAASSEVPAVAELAPSIVPLEIAKDSALAEAAKADLKLSVGEKEGLKDAPALRKSLTSQVSSLNEVEQNKTKAESALSDGLSKIASGLGAASNALRDFKSKIQQGLNAGKLLLQEQLNNSSTAVDQASLQSVSSGNPKATKAAREKDDLLAKLNAEKDNLLDKAKSALAGLQKQVGNKTLGDIVQDVQKKIDENLKKVTAVNKNYGQAIVELATGKSVTDDPEVESAKKKLQDVANQTKNNLLKLQEEAGKKIEEAEKAFEETKAEALKKAEELKNQFSQKVLPDLMSKVNAARQAILGTLDRITSNNKKKTTKSK